MFEQEETVSAEPADRLIETADAAHAQVGTAHRRLLHLIAEVDRTGAWEDSGARDTAHWLGIRYGISAWKAHRWVGAAHALEGLPAIGAALERGELGIDKVVELARFAAPDTETRLIRWALDVSCGAIRHRAELAERAPREGVIETEQERSVWWWFEEDARFGLRARLPAAQGAVVARALERMADALPRMPEEEDQDYFAPTRHADALVAICSAQISADPDPDRATVVVHAQLQGLAGNRGGCELEGGPVISPDTVRRLICDGRSQTIVEDAGGTVVGVGRLRRDPPSWMVRQLRYRDRECRFPGCGSRAFTQAHHIRWWRHGGRTDLDNLVLICSFHHRLVHEYGWSLTRDAEGTLHWRRPDGTRYLSGPSPPVPADPLPVADRQPHRRYG